MFNKKNIKNKYESMKIIICKCCELIKRSIIYTYIYIKEFTVETYFILLNPKKILIWILIFIPVFFGTCINIFFTIILYILYYFKFFKRYFYTYMIKKKQKNLKIDKPIVNINNYILGGLKKYICRIP